jgi:hypothetical protein
MQKSINKNLIKRVSVALGDLNKNVVYVGGAVVFLYADDTAASDVRSTKDIDLFLEITTYGQLIKLQEKLARKKFFPEKDHEVMCRFKYEDILVDIMSTKEVGWAPADKWFEPGLKNLEHVQIDDKIINILHVSYFLATKFNAFHDRGEDARTSRHFEDIVYVLDNRKNLVKEISESPADVKEYLIQELSELLKKKNEEAILAHLSFEFQAERYKTLREKINQIVKSY